MKNKNLILDKFKQIVMPIIILFLFNSTNVFASITEKANEIESKIKTHDSSSVSTFVSEMLGYVQWFGIAMAVASILGLGIAYFQNSDAALKGDVKTRLILFLIGGILLFGAPNLVQLIMQITV